MDKKQYQVMDRAAGYGITEAQSDEHLRNWSDKQWENRMKLPGANYDSTRAHLNFEIRDGKIQEIDKSMSIPQRMRQRLKEMGIEDPNLKRKNKNIRTVANFIFEGSHDIMHQLAFGDQEINLTRGADNSHVTRKKEIEDWALDTYKWACKRFGEGNIVGFVIHLDESLPHIHCTVLPITPQNKFSWKYWFGSTIEEGRMLLKGYHDSYFEEVSKKYGMARGEDINVTGAKHRSTKEYRIEAEKLEKEISGLETEKTTAEKDLEALRAEIKKLGIKVSSLKTMITNLEQQRDDIEAEIASIRAKIGSTNEDSAREFWMKIQSLNEKLQFIQDKISERKTMLEATQKELHEAIAERNKQTKIAGMLRNNNTEAISVLDIKTQRDLSNISVAMMAEKMNGLLPSLNAGQRKYLESLDGQTEEKSSARSLPDLSFLDALANNSAEVMQCATLLFLGYIQQATNYSVSHGGAQGPGTGWRKSDDEDDFLFGKRCIGMAAKMMKGAKKSRRR